MGLGIREMFKGWRRKRRGCFAARYLNEIVAGNPAIPIGRRGEK
jgi:hypothetical protein